MRIQSTVKKTGTHFCGGILIFCLTCLSFMGKKAELSQQSYLVAWNPCLFIKLRSLNTFHGFFTNEFDQTLDIFQSKKLLFLFKSPPAPWPYICFHFHFLQHNSSACVSCATTTTDWSPWGPVVFVMMTRKVNFS